MRHTKFNSSSQLVEEGNHLLKASKKWRMEIRTALKSEKPYLELSTSVSSELDQLTTMQVDAIDKIKVNEKLAKSALKRSEIANSLVEKAMGVMTKVKNYQTVFSEATTKKLKELSICNKSNLSHIQRLELARYENFHHCQGHLAANSSQRDAG